MARGRNYGFERRRRADLQKARQEEKRARKSERAESGAVGPEMGEAQDTGAVAGTWEWFSPSRSRTVMTPANRRPDEDGVSDWVLLTDVPEGTEGAEG
jgi:hypothetical protein